MVTLANGNLLTHSSLTIISKELSVFLGTGNHDLFQPGAPVVAPAWILAKVSANGGQEGNLLPFGFAHADRC